MGTASRLWKRVALACGPPTGPFSRAGPSASSARAVAVELAPAVGRADQLVVCYSPIVAGRGGPVEGRGPRALAEAPSTVPRLRVEMGVAAESSSSSPGDGEAGRTKAGQSGLVGPPDYSAEERFALQTYGGDRED